VTAATLPSLEPATGQPLGAVPATPPSGVAAAVAGAAAVQPLWAQLRPADRARYLRRAAQAVIDELEELRRLIAREQGRPLAEAEHLELVPAIDTLLWLADEGARVLGDDRVRLPRWVLPRTRAGVLHEPLGVVAVISAAAEPFAQPLGDVAIALMAGNGVVLKPSPHACLCGERIGRVFARAGLPEGLLRIVHGGADTGRALVAAPVDQVRLTGSPAVGRKVGAACARDLKPSTLALTGTDPMLVLADAPLERAVAGAVWGAFANAGQAAGSIARAYVARELHDRFLAGVVERARALRVGDPLDPDTDVGPLATPERAARVRALVADAVERGATLHCGGDGAGAFVAPAVLSGVPADAPLAREAVPGPVLCVAAVDDVEEAVRRANAGAAGLGASVWTRDRAQGARIGRALRAGMVWLNDHQVAPLAPQLPWGGGRASGRGRLRGEAALLGCVADKVLTWDPPAGRRPWWHPYDATLVRAGEALAWLRSARDRDRSRAWRTRALPVARYALRSLRR
jgi:acyl-CoA reductase-like NAD-dependent aldehyde dehydrogenase